MSWLAAVADEIDWHGAAVRVTVIRADGSTPREVGAAMVVSAGSVRGTIGGGALELAAVSHARTLVERLPASPQMRRDSPPSCGDGPGEGELTTFDVPQSASTAVLQSAEPCPSPTRAEATSRRAPRNYTDVQLACSAPKPEGGRWARDLRDLPLGPSLGQCCGGYVRLLFEVLTEAECRHLRALLFSEDDRRALLVRPLGEGTPPSITADRRQHHPEWPLGVTRAVREMLSGARPRAPLLVRGTKGEAAWFIEPVARPLHCLYLYGAGHVGRAIVRVLEDLPFAVTWVDTAANRFPEHIPPYATAEIAPDPAAFVGSRAMAEAFHVVLTYSHALDLAICHSLLRRGDFRFLGLIGSATKRARFLKRLTQLGVGETQLARLVCPIGVPGISGKEPAMIAVSVAAQLVQVATAAEGFASLRASGREDAAP